MTEPDPCPFEQAQFSEGDGKEQDIDLLADIVENQQKSQDYDDCDDEYLVGVVSGKRLSFLDSVKDSDQCPSKMEQPIG